MPSQLQSSPAQLLMLPESGWVRSPVAVKSYPEDLCITANCSRVTLLSGLTADARHDVVLGGLGDGVHSPVAEVTSVKVESHIRQIVEQLGGHSPVVQHARLEGGFKVPAMMPFS